MPKKATKKPATPTVKGIPIDQDVIALLKTGEWSLTPDGTPALEMPMTKDRKLYEKTSKVLKALGGQWSRKHQATIFPDDEDAEVAVREACESGIYVDSKQLFQFFETPPDVAKRMVEYLEFRPGTFEVLEPSAGHGALIKALQDISSPPHPKKVTINLTAIEIDPKKELKLRELTATEGSILRKALIGETMGDFLELKPDELGGLGYFDRIIMNPPFAKQQDMAHVRHAYQFLSPGGILVAVMSPAFTYRTDAFSERFRQWLDSMHGSASGYRWHPLPAGSFKSSGTSAQTGIMVIKRRA